MEKIQNNVFDTQVSIKTLEKPNGRSIFTVGGIATLIVLSGILLDVIIGSITGGDFCHAGRTFIDDMDDPVFD